MATWSVDQNFLKTFNQLNYEWVNSRSNLLIYRWKTQLIFCLDFGPRQLKNFIIILSYESGFYKPTALKVHPPISGITAFATMPGRLEHSSISFCSRLLIQMNGAWKMVSSVGGLNPWAFRHESSALTTRPWLLAKGGWTFEMVDRCTFAMDVDPIEL